MGKWIKVAKINDFRNSLSVEIKKKRYALFKLDDGIFAMDDVCSHEYSLLSEGEILDGDVYCPKHGSRFEIKSGKVKDFPATRPVKTYPVKVDGEDVYIEI